MPACSAGRRAAASSSTRPAGRPATRVGPVAQNRFAGKSVIVTGAANGIGFGYAEAFAAEGASVIIADIDGDAVAVAAEKIAGAHSVSVDVADEPSVVAMVAAARDR